jgi:hypothetical protein
MRNVRLRRVAIAALVIMGSLVTTQAVASANPRIDTYNYDGYSTRPCTRFTSGSRVTYTCRNINYGPWATISDANTSTYKYVSAGDISGGADYVIYSKLHHAVMEGCSYSGNWYCQAMAGDPRTRNYNTGSNYYWMAAANWYVNQGTATNCVQAMYSGDAYDIANSCT